MEGKRESKGGAATSGKQRRAEQEGEKRGSDRLGDLGGPGSNKSMVSFCVP